MKYGYITQSGAWFYLCNENGEVLEKFQGKIKLIDRIKTDNEFTQKLLDTINQLMKE